jgi:hypothetical protein
VHDASLCADGGKAEGAPGDSLLAPQRVSSPLTCAKQQARGTAGRPRSAKDAHGAAGHSLRLGSDSHSFSSLKAAAAAQQQQHQHHQAHQQQGIGRRLPAAAGGVDVASPVVLSVSAEWSAGGRDGSMPDMRLPAAVIGDCGEQEQQ